MTGRAISAYQATAPAAAPESVAVEVWWHDCTQTGPAEIESLARLLPANQRAVAARFGDDILSKRHIVAHAMTLDVLRRHTAWPSLALARGPHGKPYLAGPSAALHLRFNLSHSGAMAVVAISFGHEVGVDIERVRPDIDIAGVASLCFTGREMTALAQVPKVDRVAAFFSCWTRREALLKAQGTGLMRLPTEVEVGLGRYDPKKTRKPDEGPLGWAMREFELGAGYAGAVAVEGTALKLSLRGWQLPDDRVPPPA